MTRDTVPVHDGAVTSLGDSTTSATPPPASRATTPGWRDPRLWIGVVIVAVSVVAGARLLSAADDSVQVWAAGADLAPGDTVVGEDLVARRVRFVDEEDLGLYYAADRALPADLRLRQGVGAGELLPRSATGAAGESDVLQLPVSVEPVAVPPEVGPGSVVDVYVRADGRCPGCEEAALTGVAVVAAPGPDELTGTQQLVLGVEQAEADRWFALLATVQSPTVTILARG